nr:MAG TPA: hypothetical protein [Caudoviricetes sp.]
MRGGDLYENCCYWRWMVWLCSTFKKTSKKHAKKRVFLF